MKSKAISWFLWLMRYWNVFFMLVYGALLLYSHTWINGLGFAFFLVMNLLNHLATIMHIYERHGAIRKLIGGEVFVLIVHTNDKDVPDDVRHNIMHNQQLIHLLATTAKEIYDAEQAGDSLINELGIKTTDNP